MGEVERWRETEKDGEMEDALLLLIYQLTYFILSLFGAGGGGGGGALQQNPKPEHQSNCIDKRLLIISTP